MPKLTIDEVELKEFNYKKGTITAKIEFAESQMTGTGLKGLAHFSNHSIVVTFEEKQADLFDKKPKQEDVKAEIIKVSPEFIKDSGIKDSDLGSTFAKGIVKNTFDHDGKTYVVFNAKYNQGSNKHSEFEAVEVLKVKAFKGKTFTLAQKDALPKEERRPYHRGITVKVGKTKHVLGEAVVFVEDKPVVKKKSIVSKSAAQTVN